MDRRTLVVAALGAALARGAAAQQMVELAGVKYPPSVQVANSRLVLNGAGIRYKFVIKVYTAGLYLPARAATPEQIFAMPGPKRMHIVMLRDIDAEELGRLFTRGMEDNASKEDFSKSIPGTIRMADLFSAKKKLAAGESFGVDWTPGTGTQVMVNGKPFGEPIKEPEFFIAVLRIWLGHKPADTALKEALLGHEPRAAGSIGQ